MTDALTSFDLTIMSWMRAYDAPWLDTTMAWISASGAAGFIWLLLAGVGLSRARDRAAAWRVILTIGLAFALVDGVFKPLAARARPVLDATPLEASDSTSAPPRGVRATEPKRELPPMPRSFSFPSGHTASAVAAAVALSRMWPTARAVWWTLAILVAYSRIYLGHHYPLDVLGGTVVGLATAYWVLGGRHPATYARTLPRPLPPTVVVRP
jgi:undecaprenyl-diphosphatase